MSLYLTSDEAARLARLADKQGMTQAEIIRRAIRQYKPDGRSGHDFALIGVADGPGPSVAEVTESELLTGFGS